MLKNALFYGLLLLGACLVLYLSWQPHPQMATDWFIPRRVAAWADENRNDTIRTAVPFVALGGLLGGWLALQNRPWRQWPLAWAALLALVTIAEVGQLFLASRSFDLSDIGWGAAGPGHGGGPAGAVLGRPAVAPRGPHAWGQKPGIGRPRCSEPLRFWFAVAPLTWPAVRGAAASFSPRVFA